MGKKLSQRKRLAAIFASFAVLIIGALSLLESMTIDYYSVVNTMQKIIPASLALGGLGWVMGMILDKPKKRSRTIPTSFYLDKSIKAELDKAESMIPQESEESKEETKEEAKE